jgi:hypothetical protein
VQLRMRRECRVQRGRSGLGCADEAEVGQRHEGSWVMRGLVSTPACRS